MSFGQRHGWAMRVSTIFTLDQMDFDAIFQQINLNLSEPCDKDSAPRILRVFIRPPANFWQSFASRFLQNRDFSCYGEIFRPYITWGPLRCLVGFWPSGPKTCWGNNLTKLCKAGWFTSIKKWNIRVKPSFCCCCCCCCCCSFPETVHENNVHYAVKVAHLRLT